MRCYTSDEIKDGRHDDDDEASGYVYYDSNDGCCPFQPKYFYYIPKRCESLSAPTYDFVADHDDQQQQQQQ